ncbi:WecB/TagA/CpsF family glycosyltransferase [uncultured Thiodictyon sp.]|uniref:WecB/TagA/CpsF family glycosyltransferase n=1 Tax=uncultured Thiodictyon sp. TaxID=1846217 RepID=UPI0025EFC2F3|nr:WecB/TagA/CpsF family glycosyltransferase [uncultured Thiodictyon sp.]
MSDTAMAGAGMPQGQTPRSRVPILGAQIDSLDAADAVARIEGWIAERPPRSRHVVVTGFHGIWIGHRDPSFRAILNRADLFCPDGIAPIWLARLRGEPLPERIPGAELMRRLLVAADTRGYSSFFYGDTAATLDALSQRLCRVYPGHRIAGVRSPPFRPLSPAEVAADIDRINASGADLLWVGLGLPKQERWIDAHRERLRVPVVIGVGAAFGFLSGQVARVPTWLGEAGFEWLWRLIMEPRKLWQRDLIDGPQFLYHGLRESIAYRLRRRDDR